MAYQFHAWARNSIATQITTLDTLGTGSLPTDVRARVPVNIDVTGRAVPKQFSVVGPSDIIGIQSDVIVRTDPRPNSGDFEPNYFAAIEFYDEDFPWRYTPAAPVGENRSQLRPWLMLIVLTENEFHKTTRSSPLNSILVTTPTALPPHQELHLWAHVHANFGDPNTPLEHVLGNLRTSAETDPDGLYSRILCPRKLDPDVLYHAFLVPVFEGGRLAGLDLPTNTTPAQQPAWTDTLNELELPVYYRWQFRTGANADFETLLRLLEPRAQLDPKVGVRDLDCTHPGYIRTNQPGEVPAPSPAVLGMEGAVRRLGPSLPGLTEPVATQPFVQEIKNLLDLGVQPENLLADPVVTIPFYGYQHAKTLAAPNPVFQPSNTGWLNQINRDPRHRVAAALGTQVVQNEQEKFMQRAWVQLPKINAINQRLRHFRLILALNDRLLASTFQKVGTETGRLLALARPAVARISESSTSQTIFQTLTDSQVPNAAVSSTLRRIGRPNGNLARKLNQTGSFSLESVFNRLNPQVPIVPAVFVPGWFKTLKGLKLNANLPRRLPNIPTLNSNFQPSSNFGQVVETPIDRIRRVLDKDESVLSIGINQPLSTVKLPLSYSEQILAGLQPTRAMLPSLQIDLPKPPTTAEEVLPVMAHPDFPEPAYKYLAAINPDFIVPNLSLVPPNTIALMEPNYGFIHSFMVGINHEMARELLWREYPTDQRGTYFRQFWDPGGRRSPQGSDQTEYPYKDIKPIPEWGTATQLTDFLRIGRPFPNKPLVLLLRGDLLKKYPNIIVFAQRAIRRDSQFVLDVQAAIDGFKLPLFSGDLAPDVRLVGFDLTISEAKGTTGPLVDGQPDVGWFFVLAEVPGEPRFGMDTNYAAPNAGQKNNWDNLALENVQASGLFVRGNQLPTTINGGWPNDGQPLNTDPDLEQWARSSADMAGIFLQKPAMIAIHGADLLNAF